MAKRVFLGGTVAGSKWREDLKRGLQLEYFDPVVEEWTEENYQHELRERELCDYLLYVITPRMSGVYSIAEAVDDSNKHPEKTLFCILERDGQEKFGAFQTRSLLGVERMVARNGGKVFHSLEDVRDWLNEHKDH